MNCDELVWAWSLKLAYGLIVHIHDSLITLASMVSITQWLIN